MARTTELGPSQENAAILASTSSERAKNQKVCSVHFLGFVVFLRTNSNFGEWNQPFKDPSFSLLDNLRYWDLIIEQGGKGPEIAPLAQT